MWFYIRWTIWLLILAAIGAFLHYTLPRNDVVRIVTTDIRRIDPGGQRAVLGRCEYRRRDRNCQPRRAFHLCQTARTTAIWSIATRIQAGAGRPISSSTRPACTRIASDLHLDPRHPAMGCGEEIWLAQPVSVDLSQRDLGETCRGTGCADHPVDLDLDPGPAGLRLACGLVPLAQVLGQPARSGTRRRVT